MPRKKKDGRFINYYIDRIIYERLEQYAIHKGQSMTTAIERILQEHLDRYEAGLAAEGGIKMYCPHCRILTEDTQCPLCHRESLRLPLKEDYCFLTEKETIWAAPLRDILADQGIPCVAQNKLGAGLAAKMGPAMERIRLYVPFQFHQQAKLLEEEFFSGASLE